MWRFKIPAGRAFLAQAVANCLSSLIGLPVTWIALVLGPLVLFTHFPSLVSTLPIPVALILSSPWLPPGVEKTVWIVPLAVAVLTLPFYAMSVVSEYVVVRCFFRNLPRSVIRAWVLRANALSYAFLVLLVLTAWLTPRMAGPLFDLTEPVNGMLVDTVAKVATAILHEPSEKGADNPLSRAADANDLSTLKKLIDKGVNVNLPNRDGSTPLMLAAGRGNAEAAQMLLRAGADVNARQPGAMNSAIQYAAELGNGATVRTLLSAGAYVNQVDGSGWTPLMIAMLYGRPDVVEALLEGGANVNARSTTGWTALKEARKRGYNEIAQRLVRAGAIDYPDGSRQ